MNYLRTLVFYGLLYAGLFLQIFIWIPFYLLRSRKGAWIVPKSWAKFSLWLHRVMVGARLNMEGLENLPKSGPYILAPKHQSFFDVMVFLPFIPDPVYILKSELMKIPLFGWYAAKQEMIPIDRGSRSKALRQAVDGGRERMAEGRQLIMYPEGTRRPPGAKPEYKYGIVELYMKLGVPVVPVAHMAGLFWPRRTFVLYPGTITVRILPPIEPGLTKDAFLKRLIADTEAAADQILIETAQAPDAPPLPDTARERLKELGLNL